MFPLAATQLNKNILHKASRNLYKGSPVWGGIFSAVLWAPQTMAESSVAEGVYDQNAPLAIGYSVTIDNMHIGDLVLTAKSIKTEISLQAYVESRGVLSLLKPNVYYYSYDVDKFNQISVNKKRYKRYQYTYDEALNKTLSPVVQTLKYDNGKGAEPPAIEDTFKQGHTFLSLVGFIMQNMPVPKQYAGCPKMLMDTPIKIFTAKGQSQVAISGDTIPVTQLKWDGGSIFKPVYGCGWSLQHLYGDKAKADYYNGSQTWFARLDDRTIFPLYHRTKNKGGSVEIELLGVQESGQTLYGKMPALAGQAKYKKLWDRVVEYKNIPYPQ